MEKLQVVRDLSELRNEDPQAWARRMNFMGAWSELRTRVSQAHGMLTEAVGLAGDGRDKWLMSGVLAVLGEALEETSLDRLEQRRNGEGEKE